MMLPDKTANRCDPLLLPLLATRDEKEVDFQITRLCEVAEPIVVGIVEYQMRLSLASPRAYESLAHQDAEELHSDAMASIAQHLRNIVDTQKIDIRDFRSYVSTITYHTFSRYLHEKDPQRARIEAQIRRILLEIPEFALWDDVPNDTGSQGNSAGSVSRRIKRVRLCGFAKWRWQGKRLQETEELSQLRNAPASLSGLLPQGIDAGEMPLPQLLQSIFRWLEHPVGFQDLVSAVACLRTVPVLPPHPPREPEDFRCPSDIVEAQIYLRRLWNTMCYLTPRQAAVILLDNKTEGPFLWLFPALGVATMQQIAQLMNMEITTLVELWDRLPLVDEQIARIVGMSAQQVVQLRRSTRQKLVRQMKSDEMKSDESKSDEMKSEVVTGDVMKGNILKGNILKGNVMEGNVMKSDHVQ